jgi:hypothetical protein
MEGERDVPQKSSGADDDVGVTENRGVRIKIDSKVGRGGATAGLTQETAIVLRARSSDAMRSFGAHSRSSPSNCRSKPHLAHGIHLASER